MDENTKRAQSIVGTSEGRPDKDFYPTPAYATEALLEREQFPGLIWEPACGDGAISKVLKSYDYDVMSTDIHDYGYADMDSKLDFLKVKDVGIVDHVVTNPPFKYAQDFVERSLQVSNGKVALLLKLVFLEGQKRQAMFKETPLETVYVFSKRVQFGRNGDNYKNSGMIAFAWFVWNKNYSGKPQIDWI